MNRLIESWDWSTSAVGPRAGWPRSLKTAVAMMLASPQPCLVAWGPELTFFYNDTAIPTLGPKHPFALGRPASEVWSEIWPSLAPIIGDVMAGRAQWYQNMPFALAGRDRPVSWFSFSHTPINGDDDRVAGVYCVATETTETVLAEQRSAAERDQLTRMFEQAPGFMAVLEGPEHRVVNVNPAYRRLVGGRDVLGRTIEDALPEAVAQGYLDLLDTVYQSGVPYKTSGGRFVVESTPGGAPREHFLDFVYQPMTDLNGDVTGIFVEGHEVTQRMRAEQSLRDSEERYRTLFASLDEGLGILERVDEDGDDFRLVAANPAFSTVTGLTVAVEATWRELIGDEARDWSKPFDEVLRTGRAGRWQQRLEATGRHLELYAYRIEESSGHRIAVLINDITDRMRAEIDRLALLKLSDAIRDAVDPDDLSFEAAKILGETLHASRAGYGTVDTRAETIRIDRDWNAPGVRSIAGLLQFRDYGTYIDDLKRGETAVVADARLDPRTAATAPMLEAITARAFINMPVTEQGDFVALLFLTSARARDWAPEELALVREFAARTRTAVARLTAERDLRVLATSLEQLVEERTAERDRVWRNSRDLLVVVGADGIFRMVNPAWTTILGHQPQDVVGRSFLDFVWPADAEMTQNGLERAAAYGDLTDFENRYRHVDGSPRWISWHTTVEGDLVYAYGRDVTANKAAAKELTQAQEALRQAQKLEAIGQLTGGVAHDFNNLLTIIKSSSDLLRRPDLPEERRRKYIDAISETVSRASKLTGQLLAFARRQSLKPEVFDVAEGVRKTAEMLATVVGSRIRIVLDIGGEGRWTEADASQFETALVNLVVNARDAMDGEGVLTIAVGETDAPPSEELRREDGGAFVTVSVADTGAGMPPDRIAKIFEPFFTTKEVGKGTGLGLSQVYGFTKQSGGDVSVQSEVGKGSVFTLYLPKRETAGAAVRSSGAMLSQDDGAGARVLVVEDNPGVGAFSNQLLQDLGYETTWAKTADEALAFLDEGRRFDVVFSDVVMPGMNGIELGTEIRKRFPDLPVILTSGYSDVLAQKGRHGFELLQKPYAAEELSRVLRRASRVKSVV